MSFNNTLEVLYNQTGELLRITGDLKDSKEIRRIDIHLLLDKLRNIYDLAIDLESALPPLHADKQGSVESSVPEEIPEKLKEPEKERRDAGDNKTGLKGKSAESVQGSSGSKARERILNEEISGGEEADDITSQYRSAPISSITKGMGLNDKYELINELFGGDREKFDKCMEVLNMAGSFVEAYNYLENTFDWEMDNPYVQRLLELIRRKLIVRRDEQ